MHGLGGRLPDVVGHGHPWPERRGLFIGRRVRAKGPPPKATHPSWGLLPVVVGNVLGLVAVDQEVLLIGLDAANICL